MSKRRSGGKNGAWSTKTYKSRLWKYFHPLKYLGAEARKARRDMNPLRALDRVSSFKDLRAGLRPQTTKVNAQTRRKQVATVQRKETAAKNKATRLVNPRSTSTRKTVVAKRKKNGQFDGSKAMAPHELGIYQRALNGQVDPQLRSRTPRRRG